MSIRLRDFEGVFLKKAWQSQIQRHGFKAVDKDEARRTAETITQVTDWELVELSEAK